MPVQELRLLRPEQGRADQLIEVLRADKIWKESHGASRAWASTLVHAGPATGLIAYFLDCEDSQSLGKALDEVRAARSAGNPPPAAACARVARRSVHRRERIDPGRDHAE